jgi:hypothetical protein
MMVPLAIRSAVSQRAARRRDVLLAFLTFHRLGRGTIPAASAVGKFFST